MALTIEKVTRGFVKSIDDLEKIVERESGEAAQCSNNAADLLKRSSEHEATADQAAILASNFRNLLGI